MLTVKLKLTAVFDAQHGGFTTGWSPASWGSIDELLVNLTMPKKHQGARPESRPLRFPRLGPDARFHTVQAMRANWFIGRALNRNPNAFSAGEEGFHELAAGLFMVGYDLRDA